jgi:hypothetical protein
MSTDGTQSNIIVAGGMTSSCSSDDLSHTLNVATGTWSSVTPQNVVRRRGADMIWIDSGGDGAMMLVGGISDSQVCCE